MAQGSENREHNKARLGVVFLFYCLVLVKHIWKNLIYFLGFFWRRRLPYTGFKNQCVSRRELYEEIGMALQTGVKGF